MSKYDYSKNYTDKGRSPSPYITSSPQSNYLKITNDSNHTKYYPSQKSNNYRFDENDEINYNKSPLLRQNKFSQQNNFANEQDHNQYYQLELSNESNSNSPSNQKPLSRIDRNCINRIPENKNVPSIKNYNFSSESRPKTENYTHKKFDNTESEMEKIQKENQLLKAENLKLNSDLQKFKSIQTFMTEKGYININSLPIEQVIERVINEKDSITKSLKQKEEENTKIFNSYKRIKKIYDNIHQKLCELANIQSTEKKYSLDKLVDYLFDKKNNSSENNIKDYLISKGHIQPDDQNKTEIELINQILNEKDKVVQNLKNENNQLKKEFVKKLKENKIYCNMLKNAKAILVQKGKLQSECQNQQIEEIINKIFEDKEEMTQTLNDEINYLKEEMKAEKEQFDKELARLQSEIENKTIHSHQIVNDEEQNKLNNQIEQLQDIILSFNQTKSSMQTQIDEQIQNYKDQNEQLRRQLEEKDDIISSLKQEKEELKNKTDSSALLMKNHIAQNEQLKEQIEEQKNLILSLKQEKEELRNRTDSKIDEIKNDTIKIIKLLGFRNQTDSRTDTIKDNKTEILQLSDVQCHSAENENENENISQLEETKNSDTTEEEIFDPAKENEKLIQSKQKEILDELLEILEIEDDLSEENLASKYDPVINKVKEMIEEINTEKVTENISEDSNIEEYQKQIQSLRNNNNDLQNKINEMDSTISKLKGENTRLKQIKDSSNDLLRRHITIIQIENDKQLRRIKYLQQQEINEILKNQNTKENSKKSVKKSKKKESSEDEEISDDSEDY